MARIHSRSCVRTWRHSRLRRGAAKWRTSRHRLCRCPPVRATVVADCVRHSADTTGAASDIVAVSLIGHNMLVADHSPTVSGVMLKASRPPLAGGRPASAA
jgi:hypothetical protein